MATSRWALVVEPAAAESVTPPSRSPARKRKMWSRQREPPTPQLLIVMPPRQLVVVLAALLACGPGEKKNDDSARAAAPAQHSLMIMAQEFTFDAPDSVPAGHTRVSIMNHGTEPHHAMLIRLDSGHVAGELLDALAKNRTPAWAVYVGGPNVSMQEISEIVVDLTPGSYVMICVV